MATAYRSPAITATSDALTGAGFLAAGCVPVGVSLPALQWSVVSGAWLRPVQQRWAYAVLRPLWRDLLAVAPDVALDSRSGIHGGWLAVRDARYRLYRRVIEIRDAALVVRPHTRPSAPGAVLQSGQLRGLHGQALLADAEAALLAHAIAACLASATRPGKDPPEASAATAPGGPRWAAEPGAGEAEDEDTYGGSLAQEVKWLLAVARCYRRHTQRPRLPARRVAGQQSRGDRERDDGGTLRAVVHRVVDRNQPGGGRPRLAGAVVADPPGVGAAGDKHSEPVSGG